MTTNLFELKSSIWFWSMLNSNKFICMLLRTWYYKCTYIIEKWILTSPCVKNDFRMIRSISWALQNWRTRLAEAYEIGCQSHEQNHSIKNNFNKDIKINSDCKSEDHIGTSEAL